MTIIGTQENEEREWIDNHFAGRTGSFLDLGAFDGHTNSLTEGLIEAGWSGVMVEPDPRSFCKLHARHGANRRLRLVQGAITVHARMTPLFLCDGDDPQVTTVSERHKNHCIKHAGRSFAPPYWVYTIGVADLLGECRDLRFLLVTIDIEGLGFSVFRQLVALTERPQLAYRQAVEVFCVDGLSKNVMPILNAESTDKWECCYDANQVNTIAKRCRPA